MRFRTMMNGADVIVCATIGIVSWKRNVLGTATETAPNLTGSKPLSLSKAAV